MRAGNSAGADSRPHAATAGFELGGMAPLERANLANPVPICKRVPTRNQTNRHRLICQTPNDPSRWGNACDSPNQPLDQASCIPKNRSSDLQ